jgi:hypothetical protein
MSLLAGLFALGAGITLLASGYLFGARRGIVVRDALRDQLTHSTQELTGLSMQLQRLEQAQKSHLEKDLGALLEPLRAQEKKNEEAVREVLKLVQPVLEKDRLSQNLQELPALADSRIGLRQLLDGLAERGGFPAVVLSDEAGLPLACNRACRSPDTLAGSSSLLLILADRMPRHGVARPHSFVVHDDAGQVTLHRIFQAGEKRFLLSVVSNNSAVFAQPEVFDTPVARLRTLLRS